MENISIKPGYDNFPAIRALFDEYTQTPGVIGTCYKSYEAERGNLPGDFAQPDGRLYLAYVGDELAGCIGMRRFDAQRCEMKRLFVCKAFRGQNISELLVQRILDDAHAEGYRTMVLSTMAMMKTAHELYRRMGFKEIPSAEPDCRENVLYFERGLE
ncbi:MAG: GNAT family N-acetyltransferase [Desulfovibrio sp.]|jgi:GNAT superfamily N-acetyltransferase|nr:GNAT family N-acetyltransferase [Desulfovibrio sp.]